MTLPAPEGDDGALEDGELWPDLLVPDELWPDEPPDVAPDDDPVLVLVDVAPVCVEPGSVTASPPATASPRTPVPAVTARSRVRAR